MKKYTKEQLEELVINPKQFKKEIEESFGYIFACLKKHKIVPSMDVLIDSISLYSIRYLSTHFKEVDFTPSQYEIFSKYLQENDREQQYKNYTLQDLIADIKENKEIPYKVEQKFNLNFTMFKEHKDILVKLSSNHELYNHSPILERMFRKVSCDKFLSLGKEFLIENPQLFNLNPKFLETSELKTLYRQGIEEYHKRKHGEGSTRPQIDDFKNYKFELIEKPFAEELLKNGYWNRYRDLSHISGFTDMFSRLEFFEKYDQTDLSIFTSREIADNIDAIREALKKKVSNQRRSNWDKLVKLKVELPDFYSIYTKEYLKEAIISAEHFRFIPFDRDYSDEKEKSFHLTYLAVEILRDDPHMLQYINLADVLTNLHMNFEYHRNSITEEYKEDILYIINNYIPQYCTPYNLFSQNKNFEMFTENGISRTIIESTHQPSINYLYFLLSVHQNLQTNRKGYMREQAETLVPFITEIASHLNPEEVEKLMNYFKLPYDSNKKPEKELISPIDDSFNGNLFRYKSVSFESLEDDVILGLLKIDPNFRTYVLENNYSLSRSEKEDNSYGVVSYLLRMIDSVDHPLFSFLKQYIAQHTEEFLSTHEKEITHHVLLNDLIILNNEDKESKNYEKAIPLLVEFTKLDSQASKLNDEINTLSDKKEPIEHLKNQRDVIYKQLKPMREELESLCSTLSYDFITEKVEHLIKENNFEILVPLLNRFHKHKGIFKNHIKQLPYEELIKNLADPSFISFLDKQPSYRSHNDPIDEHAIFNPTYTYQQNMDIANSLISQLKDKGTEGQILKIVCLFYTEAKDFVKELVIKHAPQDMFYSYNYIYSAKERYLRSNTTSHYTNDEIRQGFDSLVKKYGDVLCSFDVNADYDTMISSNYIGRNEEFLELVKSYENNPIIYLLLSASDNFNQNIFTKDSPYRTRDEAVMNYMKDNFKLDILKQGVEQLIKKQEKIYKSKEGSSNFNSTLAEKAVSRLFSNVYTHEYNSNGKDRYFSAYSDEESLGLLKFIWNLAPTYIITRNAVGSIHKASEYIAKNFKEFYYDGLIEDFFLKEKPITESHFTLNSNKDNYQYQNFSTLVDGLISYLIESKKIEEIEQLVYLLDEYEFNDKRPWGKRLENFSNNVMEVFTEIPNFKEFLMAGKNMLELSGKLPQKTINTKKQKI